ncbi:MAG TPA: ATP-binding protein, partial [Blastocatellia bacterium]|nr:ATP-binding protein [Blastocatellia bacterium]
MALNRVGPPVRGDDFFGRESFVRMVSEKLKIGNVILAAPRRFGKTSVMYSLIDNPQWNYKVVHAD